MIRKRAVKTVIYVAAALCAVMLCVLIIKLPMQELKITAKTTAEEFDLSDSIRLYHFGRIKMGNNHTAIIKFIAVPNTSKNVFTRFGTGQYVYLGCDELQVKCDFISFGKALNIKLTMNAAQTDLKLEDGTPFDITRYSLKPVLTIKE